MEFLIGIVGFVAAEIGKSLVAPIKRHIGYLIYYNRNITDLKDEREKLNDKIVESNQFVQDVDKKFKLTIPGVPHWKDAANELNQKAFKFLENETPRASNRCLNGRCHPWSRYSSSRKASKMTEDIKKKIQDSPAFGNVAYDAPPPNLGPRFKLEGVKDFESRLSIINDVWEALKNDKLSIISICGMGGVGKTTLVKKFVKRVEAEKLFGVVAMIEVSRKKNLTIQEEIVEQFGLEIKEKTLEVRAGKLYEWIMKCEKSILLILDDVWEEVDFEAIGLPLRGEKKGYQIVLTSRNEDICSKIGSQKNFGIHILMKEEARDLFKEMTDNFVDGLLLHIATQIADECGGLPIAIVTIAKALKNKPKDVWDNALLQLKKSNMKGIPGMQKVHAKLQLSFDLLESEEAKSCFLLCCLFPEDYNVPIERLVSYGMGLRLFGDVKNVHEVRIRVRALIYELKESFLLLEGDSNAYYESVKMHDLLHDVAISIASTDKYAYLVNYDSEMKSWPTNTERYKNCTAISLYPSTFDEHPIYLECPKLQLLRLDTYGHSSGPPLPIKFFEGMKELKVLSLATEGDVLLLDALKELRTLDLHYLKFGGIFSSGALINLEFLQIEGGIFDKFPSEIGLLRNLRVLDVIQMEFSFIPSGVLSGLSKLEELYLPILRRHWVQKAIASLNELKSHPLTALQIDVQNHLLLPDTSNLRKFKICIGSYFKTGIKGNDQMNELMIRGFRNGVLSSTLLTNTEVLHIDEFEDEGFLVDNPSPQEMSRLRNMDVVQLPYFQNLKHLEIFECSKTKYLFPLSIARGLKQLQSIEIKKCCQIEGIFYKKEEDNENITSKDDDVVEFPKLINLTLYYFPNLIGFCVDMNNAVVGLLSSQLRDDAAIDPSLSYKVSSDTQYVSEQLSTSDMNERRRIGQARLQHCSSHCIIRPTIFLSHYQQLPNLQNLKLSRCHMLEVLLSTSVAGQLVRLKKLHLSDCDKIKYVVAGRQEKEKAGTTKIVFPMLISLILEYLPELEAFYPDGHTSFEFPSLQELLVKDCPKMNTFCPAFPIPLLTWNESVHISLPSEKPTSRSIISRMIRRGRDQRTDDSTVQHRLVSSEETKEVSLMKNNYPSSNIYDHLKACCAFPFKSMEGIRNLKKLLFDNNDALEVIFSFHEWHADGAVLNVLEELRLDRLSKLTHIILLKNIPPKSTAFQNLRELYASDCECLKYIFPLGLVKLLVKLEKVTISRCCMVEAIIGEEEEEETSHDRVVFPQLRFLELCLENLKSFYINDKSATVEFPLLQDLCLWGFKHIRTISYGSSAITSSGEDQRNAIAEKKYKDESSSHISINGMRNLKRLEVAFCNSFQVLFSIEESHVDVDGVLEELELKYLENLEHVWLNIPQDIRAFQNLKQLSVVQCHRLKYLFSPQVAKLLVKLEEVNINGCDMMEAAVGAEEDESKKEAKLVFPYLRSLKLDSLPNLRSFCTDTNVTIELPSLEHLKRRDCNQMRIFSYGTVIAAKLKEVKINYQYYPLEKDLNATDLQEMGVPDVTKDEPDNILSQDEVDVTEAGATEEQTEIL